MLGKKSIIGFYLYRFLIHTLFIYIRLLITKLGVTKYISNPFVEGIYRDFQLFIA